MINSIGLKRIISAVCVFMMCVIMVAGCGSSREEEENVSASSGAVVVGFSQLGAESDWRSANSESMRAAFTADKGYELIFEDGQQKQSKQITAIRSFIQQGVDYIVLAPVTQEGWDSVLEETRDAGIPVIIVDRMVQTSNDDLFTCWVGSDFHLEGCKACEWLYRYASTQGMSGDDLHIVNIQGTIGSSAQIGRTAGLEEYSEKYGWDLREETPGDFTQAKGREVMAQMLVTYNNINVVYCENDNEALGAIEAIEAAGKHAGGDLKNGDILVMSFDGVNEDAINYCLKGTIACIVECNPLHGPRVESIISTLESGGTPDKLEYVNETLYSSFESVDAVTIDGVAYPVTILTQDIIDTRAY
ncbi:MAG: ABC transporter substrate-binding protein [Lachnospiraceae bacterium]|nr:ABC transporter substrate-binding protein [Lachnospiraceae bacterium]